MKKSIINLEIFLENLNDLTSLSLDNSDNKLLISYYNHKVNSLNKKYRKRGDDTIFYNAYELYIGNVLEYYYDENNNKQAISLGYDLCYKYKNSFYSLLNNKKYSTKEAQELDYLYRIKRFTPLTRLSYDNIILTKSLAIEKYNKKVRVMEKASNNYD